MQVLIKVKSFYKLKTGTVMEISDAQCSLLHGGNLPSAHLPIQLSIAKYINKMPASDGLSGGSEPPKLKKNQLKATAPHPNSGAKDAVKFYGGWTDTVQA
jgi:hypothetical protein